MLYNIVFILKREGGSRFEGTNAVALRLINIKKKTGRNCFVPTNKELHIQNYKLL